MKILTSAVIFILVLSSSNAFTQLSGEIYYSTKVNLHKKLPDTERGNRMKEFMPEFMDFENVLIFNATESLYKNIESEKDDVDFTEEENRHQKMMKKRMAPVNDIVYTNIETGQVIEKKDFMDKIFLIDDSISASTWKLSGETKEVSGMNCMRADHIPVEGDTTDTIAIHVWFTPEIAVSSGPSGFGGLPGLIVHVDINDGEKVLSLSKIVMRELEEEEIEKPKKGKKVSKEEFEEIQRKKMEEMKKNWEGGGYKGH